MDTLPLQQHLVSTLKANAAVKALVGDRVYDLPPADAAFPYLNIEITDASEEFVSDCFVDWTVTGQVHVWSRTPGYVEARRIAAACDTALANRHPVFAGFRMGWLAVANQSWSRDADGLTSHGVLEYLAHYGPS